jgi:hypothetical protein
LGIPAHERRQSLGRLNGPAAADESAVYGFSESIFSSERLKLVPYGTARSHSRLLVKGQAPVAKKLQKKTLYF